MTFILIFFALLALMNSECVHKLVQQSELSQQTFVVRATSQTSDLFIHRVGNDILAQVPLVG